MSEQSSFANPAVLEFYKTHPFNIRDSVEGSVESIRRTDHLAAYPVLRPLMRPGLRVLDVGCGTGWFSNSLASFVVTVPECQQRFALKLQI